MVKRSNEEEQRLAQWLSQWAKRAAATDTAVTGRFLPAELKGMALHEGYTVGVTASFYGGWASAERLQVCYHGEDCNPVFSGVWLSVEWPSKFSHLDHRDLLGSLMGLGIDRSWFGDLILQEGRALLYAMPEMGMRLPLEWTQAGRCSIKVRPLAGEPEIEAGRGKELRTTVASLRLDCILSAALNISRVSAQQLIRQGLVSVNHSQEDRVDRQLSEDTILSVRGFGRVCVRSVGAPTRKDRLPVTMELFLSGAH